MNDSDTTRGTAVSRRAMLGTLGAAALLLSGCNGEPADKPVTQIPDPLTPGLGKTGIADGEYAPPPTGTLPPPVTTREPKNYGIIPRSAWSRGGPNLATIDPMNGVKLITFHHSGDPKPFLTADYAQTAQHLEYVREYHRSRNFQDIGYHFAIDRAGRVWQLRSLAYQGQHVRYNNEHNVGIVVLGNFEMQSMTAAQQDRIRNFGFLVRKQYGLGIERVKTHQEIVSTECPGDAMQPFMVKIRRQGLI